MYNISVEDLHKELLTSEVYFSFLKNDNTMRNVRGTLKLDLIPENKRKKSFKQEETSTYKNLRFFDLDKNEWRSLSSNIKVVTLMYE
jgi:hypothetical protein